MTRLLTTTLAWCGAALAACAAAGCRGATPDGRAPAPGSAAATRLPTGTSLDPAGPSIPLGSMPLSIAVAPGGGGGRMAAVLLGGWREQGLQVVDRASGRVVHTLPQASAFFGLAFAPDGRTLYTSGGNGDVVYRYAWNGGDPALRDSIALARKAPKAAGTRYPAGVALSPDGRTLYVAENLADSLAVVDVASGRVVARYATERYPLAVVVAANGTVYVSAWGGSSVSVFAPASHASGGAPLVADGRIAAGRHPSALLLDESGTRLYVASGSTDRVTVVDTRTRRAVATLRDEPPGAPGRGPAPGEGSTPDALALSADGTRLFVAEADNNAVAVFDLSAATSGRAAARGADTLGGRIPVEWYPTALATTGGGGDTLLVVSGKGRGTGPNPDGPTPYHGERTGSRSYTLGQTTGSLMTLGVPPSESDALAAASARVARANRWGEPRESVAPYPPIEHVLYVIKENRTYDEVLGDLPVGDGDSTLVFFPRAVTPNQHALAERFGIYDRFFVNAEVSADGHNWTTAAYATDYVQRSAPSWYSSRGRTYDYEGTNRGEDADHVPDDDVASPANGYLWDLAERAGISFRNYGELVVRRGKGDSARYIGTKPFLARTTSPRFAGFDLAIPDQRRADAWLAEFADDVRAGRMPALEIVYLPNDHTAGTDPGACTPAACVADNDLALGRIVEALSRSPFWRSTALFVVEDDAQNGPDHVDSHRAPFLVISPWARPGVQHRWTNTTDVVATIAELLHLGHLSQFDYYGRPLRDAFGDSANVAPYTAARPSVDLTARNPVRGVGSAESRRLDLSREDRVDDEQFNRLLWRAIKGRQPYPGPTRASALEWRRSR